MFHFLAPRPFFRLVVVNGGYCTWGHMAEDFFVFIIIKERSELILKSEIMLVNVCVCGPAKYEKLALTRSLKCKDVVFQYSYNFSIFARGTIPGTFFSFLKYIMYDL